MRDPQTGTRSGRLIAVQVKTTDDGTYTADDGETFQYLMDGEDVAYWHEGNPPVIIALVHLGRAARRSGRASITAGGRDIGVLTSAERRPLRRDGARCPGGAVRGQEQVRRLVSHVQGGERGHMNLLEVVLTQDLNVGASPYKTGRPELTARQARKSGTRLTIWASAATTSR
ncbi:MAG: DUF4365 domain-containing protein [Hyphomonadaceae bacterium]|nr:DUF4365 domain-containing protein [Hyphomonadaceae bacterium]